MTPGRIREAIFRVWEDGSGRSSAERTPLALEMLSPTGVVGETAALFAADAALITMRMSLFGPRLDAVVRCPECDTEFDLPVDLAKFASAAPAAASVSVEVDGFVAVVRPPATQDLLELAPGLTPNAFAAALFLRCVEKATLHGLPVEPSTLPPAIRTAAATALSARGMESPAADLACGLCSHVWKAPLDIAAALFRDIDSWVLDQLGDVHRIASAYHWSERDILAMSPQRRRFYLKAIG